MDDVTTATTEAPLVKTIYLEATPQKVWEFLTRKEHLARWYQPATTDLAPGAAYEMVSEGKRLIWGEVQAWEPPSRLVTTFEIDAFEGHPTTVTWQLQPMGSGTMLTLTHTGILAAGPKGPLMLPHLDPGWDEHFARLRKTAASGS